MSSKNIPYMVDAILAFDLDASIKISCCPITNNGVRIVKK